MEKEEIKEGDLVIIDNTKHFIKNKIYKVNGKIGKSISITNECETKVYFDAANSDIFKVQNAF